jgi:hypothetical protein
MRLHAASTCAAHLDDTILIHDYLPTREYFTPTVILMIIALSSLSQITYLAHLHICAWVFPKEDVRSLSHWTGDPGTDGSYTAVQPRQAMTGDLRQDT